MSRYAVCVNPDNDMQIASNTAETNLNDVITTTTLVEHVEDERALVNRFYILLLMSICSNVIIFASSLGTLVLPSVFLVCGTVGLKRRKKTILYAFCIFVIFFIILKGFILVYFIQDIYTYTPVYIFLTVSIICDSWLVFTTYNISQYFDEVHRLQ